MITEGNLKRCLEFMGFTYNQDNGLYVKDYPAVGCSMKVDFLHQRLIFPYEIKGRERNNGFNMPENFVVFECVDRLLEKGYRPEHIELEKEWHLGHNAKGGRADICVYEPNGTILFIIECKTYGREFKKAYEDMHFDGGQLFSYWQQEYAARWLVLYTSDLDEDGEIIHKAPTINCTDDPNIIDLAKTDRSIRLYKTAHNAEDKFAVWKETYSLQEYDDLVFSDESTAYKIGILPLLKRKLRDFTPEDKIVNRFEEILRHNNVSDKENAFNCLVALFICKLVDESTKGDDDIVEFQYKQGTDTYEILQDRLQHLHQIGMEKFMREKIVYVPADYPEWLFATYTGQQRQKAIDDLKEKIRILKFYSNNDFSFKNVHNEELFYQNGKILVEVVQLFEKYRIVYPSKHQFLGDLFEQLLNKGFKQNEGQFFTPIPIARFIWDSLPVYKLTHSEKGITYPKVIDYACGAGHFLTEAVEAINAFTDNDGDNSWVRDHIFGIEKDYRLARVSKISLFMNGAGEGNIIFGDGLENAPDKQIENNAFDVLVANPPYSVAAFKQHLSLKNNDLNLLKRIGVNGSEIEVLFIERIAQLLKPGGIAAVILPSSILSNDSASYIGARDQILQNFYIRAIVQLGSRTFGATGTNTVILFLEKFNEPPKKTDLITDSINAIFTGKKLDDWTDKAIYESYLKQIEVPEKEYSHFLSKASALEDLKASEYFKMYVNAFVSSTEMKNIQKSKTFQHKDRLVQTEEICRRFYDFSMPIEREKMFYFALTYTQKTVIITAPADNAKQKEFLGYDWSNRKGNEGIQIIMPGGKLYVDEDRKADGTLASIIRGSYNDIFRKASEDNEEYVSIVNTTNMLDYNRVGFNKALQTSVRKKSEIRSKYPLAKLSSVAEIISGGTPDTKTEDYWNGDIPWLSVADFNNNNRYVYTTEKHITEKGFENSNARYLEVGDVIISARGTVGAVAQVASRMTFNQSCYGLRGNENVDNGYLYYILLFEREQIEALATGMKFPSIVKSTFDLIHIPLPPFSVQRQLVSDCEKIDEEYNTIYQAINEYRQQVDKLLAELEVYNPKYRLSLSDTERFRISIGKRVLNTELVSEGSVPVFSANVMEPFGYLDKLLFEDFSKDSVLWGIDGDWMVRFYQKDQPFYPTDHCGVLRVLTDEVHPRYMAHILEVKGKKMNFSRSYRASIDRVKGIAFTVPEISLQNRAMEKIIDLENKIEIAEQKLNALIEKRRETVQDFL